MSVILQKLRDEIRTIPLKDGRNKTEILGVTVYRSVTKTIQMPQTENPYLYLVLDGVLRLYTPSGIMDYMAGQYSISKIDTPLSGTVLTFSERRDFLALAVEFTVNEIITSVLNLDNDLTEKIMGEALDAQTMTAADSAVIESIYRLFSVMNRAVPSEFMRRNILREVIYYILCGSCGRQFLQSIVNIGQADEIYGQTAGSRKISAIRSRWRSWLNRRT